MLGRSLLMKASGARLLYPAYVQDYLDRVTAADVAAGNTLGLELGVTNGFNTCLQDMVADTSLGISSGVISEAASKIKAMPFMCGARTLSGCLIPVVGPSPINFNFVSGDYDRKTGLLGDGSTKQLDSNRAGNLDPTNSRHVAVWISTHHTRDTQRCDIGNTTTAPSRNDTQLLTNTRSRFYRVNSIGDAVVTDASTATGFWGASRNSASVTVGRFNLVNTDFTNASGPNDSSTIHVFSRGGASFSDARLSFYSIGEFLDLAVLDARISTLMATLASAIP